MANKYNIRSGIVPVTVCGEMILVTTRAARGKCPYTVHFNESSAYLFSLLEKGLDEDEMTCQTARDFGVTEEFARKQIKGFIDQLIELGYVTAEENHD